MVEDLDCSLEPDGGVEEVTLEGEEEVETGEGTGEGDAAGEHYYEKGVWEEGGEYDDLTRCLDALGYNKVASQHTHHIEHKQPPINPLKLIYPPRAMQNRFRKYLIIPNRLLLKVDTRIEHTKNIPI